jgi:hypothetical protein
MLCVNGHKNPEGQRFCGECGAPLEAASTAESPEAGGLPPAPSVTQQLQPPSSRNWTPILVVGLLLGIVVVGLLGWLVLSSRGGTSGPLAEKHDIKGSLEAPECGGGYDIEGAAVEVRDEKDKLIGAATTSFDQSSDAGCRVTFTVADTPKASFYQVTIGTHGGPSYSYNEMKANDWTVSLSLD